MKVLITGATGLVGEELGVELTKAGHEVVVLARKRSKAAAQIPFPAQIIEWDFESLFEASALTIDAVVHLAGENIAEGKWTDERKRRIYDSRILSTRYLRESLEKAGRLPKVWVNASAIGFYPDMGDQIIDEAVNAGDDFLAKVCRDWEHEVEKISTAVRKVILRIGVVIAKRGGFLPKILAPFRLGFGGQVGSGRQWMSWIDLRDLVTLIQTAIEDKRFAGVFNATAKPLTNQEMTKEIASALQKSSFMTVPSFALKIGMGEMAQLALQSQRVVSNRLEKIGFKFRYVTFSECFRNLIDYERNATEFEYYTRQWVPQSRDSLFRFFSDEFNLEKITPKFLNFRVLQKSTATLQSGTLIDYKLRIKGVPTNWRTRIEDWNPPESFVDTQLKGPYSKWHHTHTFEALGGGTLMTDRVVYKLPAGPFGLVGLPIVKNDIENIFSYRRKIICEMFGSN